MNPIRVYADTSVYGGIFDDEFSSVSQIFFHQVKKERFHLVISPIVEEEISYAPMKIQIFYEKISKFAELSSSVIEAVQLQEAYVRKGIVGYKYSNDALHVAYATVSNCSLLVSWNFKHIVHYDKIALYNAINVVNGYGEIKIHSPEEVICYEDEDV